MRRMNSALKKAVTLVLIAITLYGCHAATEADVKRVIKEMSSPDPAVRNQAAMEAANFGPLGPKVVPVLVKLLMNDENNGVRSGAAYALRKIGTPEANKALDQATKQHNW